MKKLLFLILFLVVISPDSRAEFPEPTSCKMTTVTSATPNWYAAIEIGAKGIKPVAVEFEGSKAKTTDQFPTRDVVAYEAASLPNVVQAVCETIIELHDKYGDLPIHLVGSSGISQVAHRPDLEKRLEKATGKKIEFITAEQEMIYLGKGIWKDLPDKRRCESSLVDIGSGNVKGGYINGCNPEKKAADEKFSAFNVDNFGVAAFTKKAVAKASADHLSYGQAAEAVRGELETEFTSQVSLNPELTNGKQRIYLVGGAVWAVNTLMCLDCPQYESRSDTGDQGQYTVIKPSDIEEFYRWVTADGEQICNADYQNPYLVRNLDSGKGVTLPPEKLEKQTKQIAKVCSKFVTGKDANELLSAAEILRAITKAMNINEQRKLFFMQGNLHTWPQEYLAEKLHVVETTEKSIDNALQWQSVGEQKSLGIGGLAVMADENLLVVHDGKKSEHPRLSRITFKNGEKPILTTQDWCEKQNLPVDLEAVTAVPGYKNDFMVLESKGKVTRIRFESNKCKVTAHFNLPTASSESNMEGLSLHCFKKRRCVLAWAERGDDKTPAKLSWAIFNVEHNKLIQPVSGHFEFYAPYPDAQPSGVQLRSISDIAIDQQGMVWIGATSDPGDEGPFQSAIYKLGKFSAKKQTINWQPTKEAEQIMKFESENVKIEGLVFNKSGLFMGTDDENNGSKIAVKIIP